MTTDARSALLAFLQSEAPKAHSADDLAALLGLDRAVVDAALDASCAPVVRWPPRK